MKELSHNYHDWYILGISTDVNTEMIELEVVSDRLRSIIRFKGVKRCRIDNFTIGNIILDTEIFAGRRFTDSLISKTAFDKLFTLPNEVQYYKETINKIKNEIFSYVEISPSYGCSVMILFSDFEEVFLEGDETGI